MDNRTFKINSLANILLSYMDKINDAVRLHPEPIISQKPDNSPVTQLDLALSELIEDLATTHFPKTIFFSEEKFSHWGFPLLALDPLDGTREYIDGRPEWAISLGLFKNEEFEGEGWIYNPMTGECFTKAVPSKLENKKQYIGEVSRSEWTSGLFINFNHEKFKIEPMGSIAYKLGRLSQGQTDFVVSLRAKNIWDIAGGTLLSHQAGFKFYSKGKLVTKVERIYHPPLIWCREELFESLSAAFA